MTPNATELFARPSATKGTWMVCGYAAIAAPEKEIIRTWAMSAHIPVLQVVNDRPLPADDWNGHEVADHANLVTHRIWQKPARSDLAVLQLALRPVDGMPGLSLLSGLLIDEEGHLTRGREDVAGVMLAGRMGPDFLGLMEVEADLAWTRGMNLTQVQKKPVWGLGADEPWAARWTMAAPAVRAAKRAHELKRLSLLGEASRADEEEFQARVMECGHAVTPVGSDKQFDAVMLDLYRRGELTGSDHPLVTRSQEEERSRLMTEAIRRSFEGDEGPSW